MIELNKIYNEDCLEGMNRIPDNSVDCILTDPPYLYLKNQKLDRPFDEQAFFSECKRVLKKDGFIVIFGRGTSFYRWNCILADMGFTFKEEIVWDKGYTTSPLMNVHRIHETISIHTLGKGVINKARVPYLEQKKFNINSIFTDIKRLCSCFSNSKHLKAVEEFLENNADIIWGNEKNTPKRTDVTERNPSKFNVNRVELLKGDRCVDVMQSMEIGINEKSIIRTDRTDCENFTKYGVNSDKRQTGDRCVDTIQSMEIGMNEKTIIKELNQRLQAIHPTQKPVRLLERLLNLVCNEGCTVLDPFSGSASTAIACINSKRNYIGFEIDQEYYNLSIERIKNHKPCS